jgi:Antitoxin of toxin-antitoxin, RelE / RelB, TA system
MSDKKIREAQVIYQVSDAGDREPIAMLPIANLDLHLTANLEFADDQWNAYCPELDLATAADSEETAIDDLTRLAVEYAAEYLTDFDVYVNSANRAQHLPYVLGIARYTLDLEDREALDRVRQLFAVERNWVE